MPQLAQHLRASKPEDLDTPASEIWGRFLAAAEEYDLEAALTRESMPDSLTNHIVKETWKFLIKSDLAHFQKNISNRDINPLTNLFRYLLRTVKKEIDVVTTNYDRLAEYAAESGGIHHFTGFGYGHLRTWHGSESTHLLIGRRPVATANVWKVHGSLDWFQTADRTVIGLPVTGVLPAGLLPSIVTPGVEKYRITHGEPYRTILDRADRAMSNAQSYLCIGFGFNDQHIQPKLVQKCERDEVPLVVITKKLSEQARSFLRRGSCRQYMALEESAGGTCMYTQGHPDGIEISGHNLWSLQGFLQLAI
ncbi:SIR2 family protein [Nitrospirillum pindoramense]|nr:SIR2 family protein [Nitrospirillum amazonense]